MMLQMGIVTPEQIYNWAKDLVGAMQLDPARYLNKPPNVPEGPRHTAEEAILMIMEGRLPEAAPLEPPQQHLEKLQAEMASDNFGYLSPEAAILFKQYLLKIVQLVHQTTQQQALMQAAQRFSAQMQQGQGGGRMPVGQQPPMQMQQPTQAEIGGAARGPVNANHMA